MRASKGVTGQRLADSAKISPAYLSEVERGLSEVSGEKLLRIATSLGVSVQSLLEGTPPGSTNDVVVPSALAEAAEQLKLTYKNTVRLLQGKHSLMARRSATGEQEWQVGDWIAFYNKVKDYLEQ
jgi:transcriptional regulator with XRE-family HTH domain